MCGFVFVGVSEYIHVCEGVVGDTSSSLCLQCWETFVGQELYKLGLVNFVLSAITTLTVETARK